MSWKTTELQGTEKQLLKGSHTDSINPKTSTCVHVHTHTYTLESIGEGYPPTNTANIYYRGRDWISDLGPRSLCDSKSKISLKLQNVGEGHRTASLRALR